MDKYEDAWEKAWSIENMKAHGAEGRDVRHVDTRVYGKNIMHLYRDSEGDYWYRSEAVDRIDAQIQRARQKQKEAKRLEAENRKEKRLA